MDTSIILLCFASFALLKAQDTENKSSEVSLNKRNLEELSYSFAATDIGSKSGTRIKTITVIKNKKHRSLKINPELHKNENWGSEFRDNFDKYGKIPELPDIFNKSEDQQSNEEKFPGKPPQMMIVKKDSIPIYEEPDEEPDPTSSVSSITTNMKMPLKIMQDMPIEITQEKIPTEMLQEIPAETQVKNLNAMKVTKAGPININEAKERDEFQASRYEAYRSRERDRKEIMHRSLLQEYLRSLKLFNSNNYKFKPESMDVVYTAHQQMSTTTVANPYTAPNKNLKSLPDLESAQVRKSRSDVEPNRKRVFVVNKPAELMGNSNTAFRTDNIQYHGRFRGLRY